MLFLLSIFCLHTKFAFFSTSYTITRKHSSRMHTACLLTRKGESFMAPPSQHPPFMVPLSWNLTFAKPPFTEPPSLNPSSWHPSLPKSHTPFTAPILHGTLCFTEPPPFMAPPGWHPVGWDPSGQHPPGWHPSPVNRQTPLETLPSRNFVCRR